jgi:integrase/recombinase XerD
MRMPAGLVKKRSSYFARTWTKGGERTFALGPDLDRAVALHYRVQAAIREGRTAESIRAALRDGRDPLGPVEEVITRPDPDVTVSGAVDRWLAERVDVEMEKRNASMVRSRVERCLVPHFTGKALRSLRRPDCHGYLGHLRATRPDLQPGTLHHYMRDLRELLNWSLEVELIESNPWPGRRILPKVEEQPPDRVSDAEMAVLVSLPEHWGFTLRFLFSTGLRWGEACRARRRDIEGGQLLVRKSKTGRPRRVPLPKATLAEVMRNGGDWIVPRQRVAPGGRAERSSSSFNATIRRLAKKAVAGLSVEERKALAGLEGFHAHQTRHTFACRYLEAGGELPMLQVILGHASIEMTQRYGRPAERSIREDANRVFGIWEGARHEEVGSRTPSGARDHFRDVRPGAQSAAGCADGGGPKIHAVPGRL